MTPVGNVGAFAKALARLLNDKVTYQLVPLFTEAEVARWWLPLGAATIAINTVADTLMFLL